MRSPFSHTRANPKRRTRKSSKLAAYDSLEPRQLLATLVSFNVGSGELTVDLTDNSDTAVVDVSGGNITVNGAMDIDSGTTGVQIVAANDIRQITVNGSFTKKNQSVTLNGDMSNLAGRDLVTINIDTVNLIEINGDYELSDRLDVLLVGNNGIVDDGATGRLRVAGETNIVANNNAVLLNNASNDFGGSVTASNSGGGSMIFADANDFAMQSILASGFIQVFAGGAITDATDSQINVTGVGRFEGTSVTLGDNVGDVVNFGGFVANSAGDVVLTESSNIVLGNLTARNLTVNTTGGVFDSRFSVVTVTDLATFNGVASVRIGENGSDTFNAGSVNFNSGGHVHIWEDSGTHLVGTNTARSLDLYSVGDITDDDNASTTVQLNSGFEAVNVNLGDTATDAFNSGSIYFNTVADFSLSEDSATNITQTKNRANRMFLTSVGNITDAIDARTNVELVSVFTAAGVNLGDTLTDEFNSGSLIFNVSGQFRVSEDSNTNIVGVSSANNVDISSTGNISNVFSNNGNGASMDVQTVAAFSGANIDLGNQLNDSVNFGSLQVNSSGNVNVTEDSNMVLTANSTVSNLILTSTGVILDSAIAMTNVSGRATLSGTSITLGDGATDEFNAAVVNVDSPGAVNITEDSGMNLTGVNRAASMTLVANGAIVDTPEADTVVTGNMSLTGTFLNLGNEATDNFVTGGLSFNSSGNTFVTSDAAIEIFGVNSVGDVLTLNVNGNLTDLGPARTEVQTRAVFTGVDVVIGDLADDCFDILNGGAANLFVTASGVEDVTVACSE